MPLAAHSTAIDTEATAIEDGPQETSHSSTRDSIVTVRFSDSTTSSIQNKKIADDMAHECAIEDSANMVDIRLSDPGFEKSTREEEIPETPFEGFPHMEDTLEEDTVRLEESDTSILPEEVKVIQKIHRQSTISFLSAVDEASSDAASSSVRSRSDSSGTFSSLGSANVDWLELEKKEEEAPRDEASDEVGLLENMRQSRSANSSYVVNRIPSR